MIMQNTKQESVKGVNMKKHRLPIALLTGLILVLILVPGCNGLIVKVPDRIETKQYDFNDFSAVDIGDAFSFEITAADSYSIKIQADEELQGYIDVRKTGQTLKIDVQPTFNFRNRGPLKAFITMPSLGSIVCSGAADGIVSGFESSEKFIVELSGASEMIMRNITAGDMTCTLTGASELEMFDISMKDVRFDLSGASDMRGNLTATGTDFTVSGASSVDVNGSADDLSVDASDASDIRLSDFAVSSADITLSGASECRVNADSVLETDLSGSSELYYRGTPSITRMDVSGGSEINRD
jgi:hypothetical protein